jgi:hypothetical protein
MHEIFLYFDAVARYEVPQSLLLAATRNDTAFVYM